MYFLNVISEMKIQKETNSFNYVTAVYNLIEAVDLDLEDLCNTLRMSNKKLYRSIKVFAIFCFIKV